MEGASLQDEADTTVDEALALAWSGGKDAALALHALADGGRLPRCLLTTVIDGTVPHHQTPIEVVEAQARAVGLPLVIVEVPQPFDPEIHSTRMRQHLPGVGEVAFGDLFLDELRRDRERTLGQVGVRATFPVWGGQAGRTARRILDEGIRALIVAVDTAAAPADLLGREYDLEVVERLEASGADPCGESGEIHTVVVDAPRFEAPLELLQREVQSDGRFAHLVVALGHAQDLSWMPAEISRAVDRTDLATLTRSQLEQLHAARRTIGWPVVAYRREAVGTATGPCELLRCAPLDDAQGRALHALEAELGLPVVAYTPQPR